jgi:hypothetical protein
VEGAEGEVVVPEEPAGLDLTIRNAEAAIESLGIGRKPDIADFEDLRNLSGPESARPVFSVALLKLKAPVATCQ